MIKLIRDKVPVDDGGKDLGKVGSVRDYSFLLLQKLHGETLELGSAIWFGGSQAILEELADIFEVVRATAQDYGFTMGEVFDKADKKREERGSFREGRMYEGKGY